MSEFVVFDDGPRELTHLWLCPDGSDGSDRGFVRRWRFWTWFSLNADYGAKSWPVAIWDGLLMARRLGGRDER